ncbi:hypothetical protein LTR84_005447 [Exophiala bonariae]|uniref:Uncharacterized protein n=1 Tax=Exophiala bonariae TaxID=1690606 RepID=A0AAV9N3S5_9EURO|nr:hypothetical protein LTR84_005447 [Exophiala bonariae]
MQKLQDLPPSAQMSWRTPRSCRNCRDRKNDLSDQRHNRGLHGKSTSARGLPIRDSRTSLNLSSIEEWPYLTQQPDQNIFPGAPIITDTLPDISSSESVGLKLSNATYDRFLQPSQTVTPPPLPTKTLRFSGLYLPDIIWAPTICNQSTWQISPQKATFNNQPRCVWSNNSTSQQLSCDILPKGDELDGHHDRIMQMIADLVFESDDATNKHNKEFQNGFAVQEDARVKRTRLSGAASDFRPGSQYHQRES